MAPFFFSSSRPFSLPRFNGKLFGRTTFADLTLIAGFQFTDNYVGIENSCR